MIWLVLLMACEGAPPPEAPPPPPAVEAAPPPPPPPPPPPQKAAPLEFLATATGDGELPLVIMVHGLGDRPPSMLRLLRNFAGPARVVAPQAPEAYGDGFSWFAFHWEREGDKADAEQLAAATAEIAALGRWLAERHPTRGKPVVSGFSQGGMVSFAAAATHPDAFAAAVPLAGYLPSALVPASPPAHPIPVRALHGAADETVHVSKAERSVADLKKLGYDATLETFEGLDHSVSPAMLERLYAHLQASLP